MEKELLFLKPFLTADTPLRLGLLGVGSFGNKIRSFALSLGIPPENILLCDPPRSREEAEEINDALHTDWGNGMGGCYFSSEIKDTFLPLSSLAKADILSIQIPLTEENKDLIGKEFLSLCSPKIKILSFSPEEIFEKEVRKQENIFFFPGN